MVVDSLWKNLLNAFRGCVDLRIVNVLCYPVMGWNMIYSHVFLTNMNSQQSGLALFAMVVCICQRLIFTTLGEAVAIYIVLHHEEAAFRAVGSIIGSCTSAEVENGRARGQVKAPTGPRTPTAAGPRTGPSVQAGGSPPLVQQEEGAEAEEAAVIMNQKSCRNKAKQDQKAEKEQHRKLAKDAPTKPLDKEGAAATIQSSWKSSRQDGTREVKKV